jgi:heme-degrading monooxygenase HmoA
VTIKVIVEFHAKPGARAELAGILKSISATHGPSIPGFLGTTVHEVVDSTDALVEIAEWASAEDQAAAVAQAMASGLYAPVIELVAAPFRVTRISPLDEPE